MAGPLILMLLGPYMFGLETAAYQRLRRTSDWRWAEQPRLGRRPATQYLGPGSDVIELDGVIHPHFKGGLRQVTLMRLVAGTGLAWPMVDGTGITWGLWGIERIEERQAVFLPGSAPREIRFSLTVRRHGEDLV
jgi:phage protein U